jgi:polyhydroxybutyrate depolymerase
VKTMTRTGLLVALAVALAGCGNEPGPAPAAPTAPPVVEPAPGDHTLRLDVGGVAREALVHAPPAYRPGTPTPLVLVFHGRPSTPAEVREQSGLSATADAEGFLVAYPQGLNNAWRTTAGATDPDDLGFVRALVADLVGRWSADPKRVYAAGFSNGAAMSYRLGAEAPDLFAAVAPVSGQFAGGPKPATPVSVISFMGNNDRYAATISGGRQKWREVGQCVAAEPRWVDDAQTVNRTDSRCADGSVVLDYTVNGMGHEWPREPIDANALMWEFFAEHAR